MFCLMYTCTTCTDLFLSTVQIHTTDHYTQMKEINVNETVHVEGLAQNYCNYLILYKKKLQ